MIGSISRNNFIRQQRHGLLRPTLSASCSQPRITASRGYILYTAAPATPRSVQWRPFVAEWHTYDATATPARRLSQVSRKATSGNRSKGTTSRPPSEPSYNQQALQSVSPRRISAHSLLAGGGLTLLTVQVDPYTIHLVGRWRSNKILRYLHTTAKSFTKGLLAKMFEHGAYTLIPPTHAGN